MNFDKTSGRG